MLVLALVMDYFKTEAQPILDRWMTNNASTSSLTHTSANTIWIIGYEPGGIHFTAVYNLSNNRESSQYATAYVSLL